MAPKKVGNVASRFVGGGVWKAIRDLKGRRNIAAIAYLGSNAPELLQQFQKGDVIVCDASDATIKNGGTSIEAIKKLRSRGVIIYSHTSLHAKVLVIGRTVVVGSMNASSSSTNLDEAAIVSTTPTEVIAAKRFVQDLTKKSVLIDETFVHRATKLHVRTRKSGSSAPKPSKAKPIVIEQFDRGDPPKFVARAFEEQKQNVAVGHGFRLKESWSSPNDAKRRCGVGQLQLAFYANEHEDPFVEIGRIVDFEKVRTRWVYYEVTSNKASKIRLSKIQQVVASLGYRRNTADLLEGETSVRLDGFEEDLRQIFGDQFPPEL